MQNMCPHCFKWTLPDNAFVCQECGGRIVWINGFPKSDELLQYAEVLDGDDSINKAVTDFQETVVYQCQLCQSYHKIQRHLKQCPECNGRIYWKMGEPLTGKEYTARVRQEKENRQKKQEENKKKQEIQIVGHGYRCPHCKSTGIPFNATKCRYCTGEFVMPELYGITSSANSDSSSPQKDEWQEWWDSGNAFLFLGLVAGAVLSLIIILSFS